MSQANLAEKKPTIVERVYEIVRSPMRDTLARRKLFAEYLQKWMDFNGQRPADVETTSKKTEFSVSDATVAKLLLAETTNDVMCEKLLGVANGISRPPEEVYLAWIGQQASVNRSDFQQSDFANLWNIYKQLPNGEQKYFKRILQMLAREMLKT